VIDLAKDAANGVRGHVGLSVDAPIAAVQEFGKKFEAKFNYKPDHNGLKGYIAPYMIKAAAEQAGKRDAKAIATALHGLTITPDKVPGILIEASWDDSGEIDRICLLA
jgi:branched-chain amino acid transport system substrate-binding protein